MSKKLLIGNLGFATIALFFLGLFIYQLYFEKKLKSRSVVNEIVTMKIDSSKVDTIFNSYMYTFYVNGKYRICIDRKLSKPYISTLHDDVIITDLNGNCVLLYNTRYSNSWGTWKSDYQKLLKYLKLETL